MEQLPENPSSALNIQPSIPAKEIETLPPTITFTPAKDKKESPKSTTDTGHLTHELTTLQQALTSDEKNIETAQSAFKHAYNHRQALSQTERETFAELLPRYLEKYLPNRLQVQLAQNNHMTSDAGKWASECLREYAKLAEWMQAELPSKAWTNFCEASANVLLAKGYCQPEDALWDMFEPHLTTSSSSEPLSVDAKIYYSELYMRLSDQFLGARTVLSGQVKKASTLIDVGTTIGASFIPIVGTPVAGAMQAGHDILKHRAAAQKARWARTLPEIDELAQKLAAALLQLRKAQLPTLQLKDFDISTKAGQAWRALNEKESFSLPQKLALSDMTVMMELCVDTQFSPTVSIEERVKFLTDVFIKHLETTAEDRTLSLTGKIKKKLHFTPASPSSPTDPKEEKIAYLSPALQFPFSAKDAHANAWYFAASIQPMTEEDSRLAHIKRSSHLQLQADYWQEIYEAQLIALSLANPPKWSEIHALLTSVTRHYEALTQPVDIAQFWQPFAAVWSAQKDTEDFCRTALNAHLKTLTMLKDIQAFQIEMMGMIDTLTKLGQTAVACTLLTHYQQKIYEMLEQLSTEKTHAQRILEKQKQHHHRQATRQAEWLNIVTLWLEKLNKEQSEEASFVRDDKLILPLSPDKKAEPTSPNIDTPILHAWQTGESATSLESYCSKTYHLWHQQLRQGLPAAQNTLTTLLEYLTQLQTTLNAPLQTLDDTAHKTALLTTEKRYEAWQTCSDQAIARYRAFDLPLAADPEPEPLTLEIKDHKDAKEDKEKSSTLQLVHHIEAQLGKPPCGFAIIACRTVTTDTHVQYANSQTPPLALLIHDPDTLTHPYWQAYAKMLHMHQRCTSSSAHISDTSVTIATPQTLSEYVIFGTYWGHSEASEDTAAALFENYQHAARRHVQTASPLKVPFSRAYGYEGLRKLFSQPLLPPNAQTPEAFDQTFLAPLRDFCLQLGLYYGVPLADLVCPLKIIKTLSKTKRISTAFVEDLEAALLWGGSRQSLLMQALAENSAPPELTEDDQKDLQQHFQRTLETIWHISKNETVWELTRKMPEAFDPLLSRAESEREALTPDVNFLADVIVHRQQFDLEQHRVYLEAIRPQYRLSYIEKLEQALPKTHKDLAKRLLNLPSPSGRRLAQEKEKRDWEANLSKLWTTPFTPPRAVIPSKVEACPEQGRRGTPSLSHKALTKTPRELKETSSAPQIMRLYPTPSGDWRTETHTLLPEVAEQLFKPNGEWRDKNPKLRGNHRVYPITLSDEKSHAVWVKVNPEQPAIDYLVTAIDRRLGVNRTPAFELVKFIHGGHTTAATLTSTAEGDPLQTIVDKTPDQLTKLTLPEFVRTLLRVLLTNPEDDKGDDYFFTKFGELMRIDNERAFFKPDITQTGILFTTETLMVKSIIYCLEHMRMPWGDDPEIVTIVKDFSSLQPVSLMSDVLHQADHLHDAWNLLFTEAEVAAHFRSKDPGCSLPTMCIPKGLANELISRLTTMHTALQLDSTSMTGLQLLKVTQPKLAQYYETAHDPIKDNKKDSKEITSTPTLPIDHTQPSKRFQKTIGPLYKKDAKGHFQTKTQPLVAIQSTLRINIPIEAHHLPQIRKKEMCSAKQELQDFENWTKKHRKQLFQDILAGESSAILKWEGLPLRHKQFIFDALQKEALAQKLTPKQQRFILRAIANIEWQKIDLRGFETKITDELLEKILKKSGQKLLVLNISGCTMLTEKTIQNISKYNPNLQELYAQHLQWTKLDLTPFIHLKYLDLSYSKIELLTGEAPNLINLQLTHCEQLKQLGTKDSKTDKLFQTLKVSKSFTLNLESCINLKDLYLSETSLFKEKLDLNISDCPSLKEINIHTDKGWLIAPEFITDLSKRNNQILPCWCFTKNLNKKRRDELLKDVINCNKYPKLVLSKLIPILGFIGIWLFLNTLGNNRTSTYLDCSANTELEIIHFITPVTMICADVLKLNCTLTHLDLSNNFISDTTLQALAKALQKNHILTHLNLSANYSSNIRINTLAEALQENDTLKQLDLSGRTITDIDIQALAKMLKTNTSLINLGDPNFSLLITSSGYKQAVADIKKYLKRNRELAKQKAQQSTSTPEITVLPPDDKTSPLATSDSEDASDSSTHISLPPLDIKEIKREVEAVAIPVPQRSPSRASHSAFFGPPAEDDKETPRSRAAERKIAMPSELLESKGLDLLKEIRGVLWELSNKRDEGADEGAKDKYLAYEVQLKDFEGRGGRLGVEDVGVLREMYRVLKEESGQRKYAPTHTLVVPEFSYS